MTQHPGQPDDARGPGDGDHADPYASPSSDTYGSLPPAGTPTPPPYGSSGSFGGPEPGQQPYGQQPYGQQPYGQQPYGGYQQPMGYPPPNYLVWAILSTLFCCLPLGVVSIVFAAQVSSKWSAGDVAGARDSSDKAKKFAIWSALAAVIFVGLFLLLVVMIGVGGGLRGDL